MNEQSFEMINEEEEEDDDDYKDEIRIVYLEKEYIPEIKILDKNIMICDGIECQIGDYYDKIKEKN